MVILIAALCMNMGRVRYKNYSNAFDLLTYNTILLNKWYYRFTLTSHMVENDYRRTVISGILMKMVNKCVAYGCSTGANLKANEDRSFRETKALSGASRLWSACWSIKTMKRLFEHQGYGAHAVASRLYTDASIKSGAN